MFTEIPALYSNRKSMYATKKRAPDRVIVPTKRQSQANEIRRVHSVRSNVTNSIQFALFVRSGFFNSIGRSSNVEYSTSAARPIKSRIFKIRPAQDVVCNF